MKTENEIPRRAKMWQWCCAEILIHQAMQEVEKMGADERLTKAVTLLSDAKNAVADFVDNINQTDYDKENNVHYWKCPECNSLFATSKYTPEWVAQKMSIIHNNNYYNIPCRAEYVEITKEEFLKLSKL
jgi:hypothetical protein